MTAELVTLGALELKPRTAKWAFSPTGLTFTGPVTFEEWGALGEWLQGVERSIHFYLGDWLNYGEQHFSGYAQLADETGYSAGTLANDKWVCQQIPSSRRREELPFAYHQSVAALEPTEQDAMLDVAIESSLTRAELRTAVALLRQRENGGLLVCPECQGDNVWERCEILRDMNTGRLDRDSMEPSGQVVCRGCGWTGGNEQLMREAL